MRSIFSSLLVAIIAAYAVFAVGDEIKTEKREEIGTGTCGDSLTWEYWPTAKKLIIKGTGAMYNYSYNTIPWEPVRDRIETFTVEEGCTFVGNSAAAGLTYLKTVNLPSTLTSIGDSAFYNCKYLETVTIPASVKKMAIDVFSFCENLETVTFGSDSQLTSIPESTFENCTSLKTISVPSKVTSIGKNAFHFCEALTSVTTGNKITSIGEAAFSGCSSLSKMTFSSKLTKIGANAFSGCKKLPSVKFPGTLTTIGNGAFYGCSKMTEVNITANITSIGVSAFCLCSGVTVFRVSSSNTKYKADGSVLFNHGKTELIQYPLGKSNTSYTVPSTVTAIGSGAFSSARNLKKLKIPSSVTSISSNALTGLTNLKAFEMDSNTDYKVKNGMIYIGDNWDKLFAFPCGKSTDFTVPSDVRYIYDYAFKDCSNLVTVTLSESVESIFQHSFAGCTSLKYLFHEGHSNPCSSSYSDTFAGCDLKLMCTPLDYSGTKFCGSSTFCRNPNCHSMIPQINECYDVTNCVVMKTQEASIWESKTSGCEKYECVNDTGNIRTDLCEIANDKPQCFNYYCGYGGKCSNLTTYTGNTTGCVKSIKCTSKGWAETAKNCTADLLADPSTSKFINEKTASCYDFSCGNGGKCSYTAHDTCGKVCKSIESECKANVTSCNKYAGCNETRNKGIWEAVCVYDNGDGYEDLKQQENQCYEVVCEDNEWVVKKRLNATEWEARTTLSCEIYECDNETGGIKRDLCTENNAYPKCFSSVCQSDGTCSNRSLYSGNYTGCVTSIMCTEEGWNETERNCTEYILSHISETTIQRADDISCYEITCMYGECSYYRKPGCYNNLLSGAHQTETSFMMMTLLMVIFIVLIH